MNAEAAPDDKPSPSTPSRPHFLRRNPLVAALAAAACVIVIGMALSMLRTDEQSPPGEVTVDRSARGAFDLVDPSGRRITEGNFSGKFMLVFFGYTSCPDVCPTDLQVAGAAIDALGPGGEQVQPIFITLDPERDTAEVMAAYVRHFHPRFLGLSGTPEQIALAAQTYGVIYVMAPPRRDSNGSGKPFYLIDHSALLYLLGPDGRFVAAFPHGTGVRQLAAGIAKQLSDTPS